MRFDVDRLSQLAGVPAEGKRRLSEASNRSYHDKVANDDADYRFGKNQLSELGEPATREPLAAYEEDALEEKWGSKKGERSRTDPGDEDDTWREGDDPEGEDPEGGKPGEEVVLEIDEGMLRREILRMKRSRLEENRLRGAIRHEIKDIFASLTNDNSWVYGNNKPRNSKRGSVSMGFTGFGFKNK
jgi:hypothetical protein